MRRAVAVAIALGLPSVAHAGEIYMGMSAGPSPAGHDALFDATYSSRGHAAIGYLFGVELKDVTLDMVIAGAGYTLRDKPAPADTALLWFGLDLGRRVWIGRDLALGAIVGLHAAKMLKWSDEDQVPEPLQIEGAAWAIGGRLEYVLGRLPPHAGYCGPIKILDAAIVIEARRERMFLSSEALRVEPTMSMVTAGLRFGMVL